MDSEPLPLYKKAGDVDDLTAWADELAKEPAKFGLPLTHMHYSRDLIWVKDKGVTVSAHWRPGHPNATATNPVADDDATRVLLTQKRIIETFFRLVRMGHLAGVQLFIERGLVSPDVTDGEGYDDTRGGQYPWPELETNAAYREHGDPWAGATPLLAAIDEGWLSRKLDMIRLLLHLGADVNAMARPPNLRLLHSRFEDLYGIDSKLQRLVRRTPLMLAAAKGNAAICRLLLDEYHADDTLVAPDGQIALRLAVSAGHSDIVALLPARHGGALKRLAAANMRSAKHIRDIGGDMLFFTQGFLWHLPKMMLYDYPVSALLEPLGHRLRHAWQHRSEIPSDVGRFLQHLPENAWPAVRALTSSLVGKGKTLGQLASGLTDVIRGKAYIIPVMAQALGMTPAEYIQFIRGLSLVVGFSGYLTVLAIAFIPRSMWRIVKAIGKSFDDVLLEIRVHFDPKAV